MANSCSWTFLNVRRVSIALVSFFVCFSRSFTVTWTSSSEIISCMIILKWLIEVKKKKKEKRDEKIIRINLGKCFPITLEFIILDKSWWLKVKRFINTQNLRGISSQIIISIIFFAAANKTTKNEIISASVDCTIIGECRCKRKSKY